MKHIGLLIIATNKYVDFLQQLIESADLFFLKNHTITYYIFTDKNINFIKSRHNIVCIPTQHYKWPWMTLGRYKLFTKKADIFKNTDYLFYCDVDMKFVDTVDTEILSERVATQHPSHYNKRGTPETNPKSLAYVAENETMQYFAGGFNGGLTLNFLEMSKTISKNIDTDYSNGIVAIWHDESHLNRFLINNPPTKILSPSYCYAESWNLPFEKKLLALDKNHMEYRS